jgi:two-component system C4-dicarboxylate transport sensor histidine kinase DctB
MTGLVPFTNELLRQSALSLDVSDIYLMDLRGATLATSNYRSDWSFLGRSFAYRPYFTDAMSEGSGGSTRSAPRRTSAAISSPRR